MLAGVFERAPKPSMQFCPSHQAEDIGATFGLPSSLSELTRTTGVPKYRMAGSTVRGMRLLSMRIVGTRHEETPRLLATERYLGWKLDLDGKIRLAFGV